jgi:hypothetical protein
VNLTLAIAITQLIQHNRATVFRQLVNIDGGPDDPTFHNQVLLVLCYFLILG